MIPAAADIQRTHEKPIVSDTPAQWRSCKIQEFVHNTEVISFHSGFFSTFTQLPEDTYSNGRVMRVLQAEPGKWFAPTFQHSVESVAGNFFLFRKKGEESPKVYGYDLKNGLNSDLFGEIPEWAALHEKYPLADGKILEGYRSPTRAEIWREGKRIINIEGYTVTKKMVYTKKILEERNLIAFFCFYEDVFYIDLANKLTRIYDRHPSTVQEFSKTRVMFDSFGKIFTQQRHHAFYHKVEDPVRMQLVEQFSKILWDGPSDPDEKKEQVKYGSCDKWVAAWTAKMLRVADAKGNTLFDLEPKWGTVKLNGDIEETVEHGRIQSIFFDDDTFIVFRIDKRYKTKEFEFQLSSGPTQYEVYETHLFNRHLEFYDNQGQLKQTVQLDFLETYLKKYNIVHANAKTFCLQSPSGSVGIYDLDTRISHGQFNSFFDHNESYIIDQRVAFNLRSGEGKANCDFEWQQGRLSGNRVAVIKPEKKVAIVNLETDEIEFSETCEETPKKIVGFASRGAPDDFLAVQFEKCIQIWYRVQEESESRKKSRK